MIDQGLGGDVVYVTSKNASFAGPANIAYSAAKADQAHQVRLLAVELGDQGIRVNGVARMGLSKDREFLQEAGVPSVPLSMESKRKTSVPSTPNGPF